MQKSILNVVNVILSMVSDYNYANMVTSRKETDVLELTYLQSSLPQLAISVKTNDFALQISK